MKLRILPTLVAGIMTATFFLSSCLGNDYEEIDYPSTSSITSFSIGTLHQTFYVKSSKGEDSVYTDTISYADVVFTIDQINRKIYNKDSLPKDVDVTRALASISADYPVINYVKNGKDTVWTETDSIDFSKPVTFKVMTYSPTLNQFKSGYPYEVTVNVHKLNPDSLVWKHIENNKFANGTVYAKQKAVYANEYIYVFGETTDGTVKVNKSKLERGGMSNWEEVAITKERVNIYSATAFNDNVYFEANGELYTLNNQTTKIGNLSGITNLISVCNGKLLAYKANDNKVIAIDAEGNELTDEESNFVNDNTLDGRLSAISMPSSHNNDLWRTIVMTNNTVKSEADTTANVFSHISNDKNWVKYQPNSPTICPNQGNISMITYDGKIYAFGEDFDYFYLSSDNGLNWKKDTGYMVFPTENKNGIDKLTNYRDGGSYSVAVENNGNKGEFIWFIWKDGSSTRALLNRLMPKE